MSESPITLWEKIQTYLIVTLIAALIWLYAEDENVRDYTNEPATVRFVAPESRELLIEPATPQAVRVTVRATPGQYGQFKQLFELGPIDLLVKESADADNPMQPRVLKEMLAANDRIAELGVTVTDVEPATLPVRVERLVLRDLPVMVDADNLVLAGPATVEPIHAMIRIAQSDAGGLDNQKLLVRLRDVPNLASLGENVAHTVELPIHAPAGLRSDSPRIEPARVKVVFTIRSQTDALRVTTVPVLVQVPPAAMGSYNVNIDEQHQFLRDVELSGPSDTIAAIRRGDLHVNAILQLTSDDLDAGIKSKMPVIDKPAGVSVVSTILPISITITRLPTEPTTTPAP